MTFPQPCDAATIVNTCQLPSPCDLMTWLWGSCNGRKCEVWELVIIHFFQFHWMLCKWMAPTGIWQAVTSGLPAYYPLIKWLSLKIKVEPYLSVWSNISEIKQSSYSLFLIYSRSHKSNIKREDASFSKKWESGRIHNVKS